MRSLLATIAATAVASTACKKTPKPPPEDTNASPLASSIPAVTDWTAYEMKTVNTTSPVEGISIHAYELDSDGKKAELLPIAAYGVPCTQSSNTAPTSCQKRYELVQEQEKTKRAVFAIVTHYDRFQLVTDQPALRALLGEIDTPLEAELLASFAAQAKRWSPQCDGMSRTIVVTKASPSGYTLSTERRLRKGTFKMSDGTEGCSDCIIAEKRSVTVRPNGEVALGSPKEDMWMRPMGCGRSPGWTCASTPSARPRTAGEYLARAAHLEAASVAAFARIAEELEALGAPSVLVERARRAAIEEETHARLLGDLARAHGAEPPPFVWKPYELRGAFELALDNTTEGCVNETFGALVLHVQALTAEDAAERQVFASIAEDEARHAELSHDVADWLDGRLSRAERETVRRASTEARDALVHGPALDDELELRKLGLPDPRVVRALHAGFDAVLRG